MNYRSLFKVTVFLIATIAIVIGVRLVRADLATDFVGVTIDYVLNGPSNVSCAVPADTDRRINITWTDGDDNESGFYIDRRDTNSNLVRFQAPAVSGSGTIVTFTDTRALPDQEYTYTISSFLGPAESRVASTPNPCSTKSAPKQPTQVQVQGLSPDSLQITWQDNSDNEDGFKIYRYPQGQLNLMSIIQPPAEVNTVSYNDLGLNTQPPEPLQSNTTYCYYVVAYNSRLSPDPIEQPSLFLGQPVCGKTFSQQPVVTFSLTSPVSIKPLFNWNIVDPDHPNNPVQSSYRIQVCAQPFSGSGDNDCPDWRWDSGKVSSNNLNTSYLGNYNPDNQADAQHPLDFGINYYVRLKVWDDTDTPNVGWAPQASGLLFSTEQFSLNDSVINNLTTSDNLTLGTSVWNGGNGGEIIVPAGAAVQGTFNTENVTAAQLNASQAVLSTGGITWQVKRNNTDTSWQLIVPGGAKVFWAAPKTGLIWQATNNSTKGGDNRRRKLKIIR